MRAKRLGEDLIEEFKQNWETMSFRDLSAKYGVSLSVLKIWSKVYECKLPKQKVLKKEVINARDVKPAEVLQTINAGDIRRVNIKNVEELRQCNEEFMALNNNMEMPKRQKDEAMCNLALKAIGVYVSNAPDSESYIEGMVNFFKLKQYEKRVNISEKESAEIDTNTMRNLKRKHVKEVLDDINAELNDGEKKFFEHLVQIATDKVMARKRLANEQAQQRALETSGSQSAFESGAIQ